MIAAPLALLLAVRLCAPARASESDGHCGAPEECRDIGQTVYEQMKSLDEQAGTGINRDPSQRAQAVDLVGRYTALLRDWRRVDSAGLSAYQAKAGASGPAKAENLESDLMAKFQIDDKDLGAPPAAVSSRQTTPKGGFEPAALHQGPGPAAPEGRPGSRAGARIQAAFAQAGPPPAPNPAAVAQTKRREAALGQGVTPQKADGLVSDYLSAESPQDASRLASEVLANQPKDSRALSLRAQARALEGDAEGSYRDAKAALALDPDDAAARALVGHREELAQAASRVRLRPSFGGWKDPGSLEAGGAAQALGPAAGAAGSAPLVAGPPGEPGAHGSDAEGAEAAAQPSTPPLSGAGLAHYQNALDGLRIGDFSGALLEATAAVDAAPGSAQALVLRAEIDERLENPKGALEDSRRALAIDPKNAAALRAKAYAELQLGEAAEALADAQAAVELEPGSAAGYLYRAMAEEKLGRAAQAAADYAKAEALDAALAPLAEAGLGRLKGTAPAPRARRSPRLLLRGGLIALSLLLVALGLAGTAPGRRAATTARALLGRRCAAGGPSLAGGYRMVREVGRGGMGVVYEAFDEALQRRVAVKRLQREAGLGQAELELLLKEARLVAKLEHPAIAQIYSVVQDGEDLYLVFEYLEGTPLHQALLERVRFPPAEALAIVEQVAAGVGHAHAERVIHRDLKPSNVMALARGGCKVLDFGIAHQARGAATTLTAASGTPHYMAPEQMLGSVCPASDLYALGVMAYELLVGHRPFEGPDFLGEKRARRFAPPSASGLPPGLDEFFRRALDPDPAGRPADAAAFVRELARALGPDGTARGAGGVPEAA